MDRVVIGAVPHKLPVTCQRAADPVRSFCRPMACAPAAPVLRPCPVSGTRARAASLAGTSSTCFPLARSRSDTLRPLSRDPGQLAVTAPAGGELAGGPQDLPVVPGFDRTGSHLMDIHGIGPAGAARILADVGGIARFPHRGHFASWTGTAPVDASSGQHLRHRLPRAGNRRLNHVLYIAGIVQLRYDTAGRACYRAQTRRRETSMEAMRCLRRRLSDAVYRQLAADTQQEASPGGHPGASLTSSAAGLSPDTGTSDQPLPGPAPPTLRPPIAWSMARPTAGGSGTRTTLEPLPHTRSNRWPRSSPRSAMSAPVTSKMRRPSSPSIVTSAKSDGFDDWRAVVSRAPNCRWVKPRVGDSGGTAGRRTCSAGERSSRPSMTQVR
jgi:Transposase IS116/IS110/IS902 family